MNVWIVTPAHGRERLAEVVYRQRAMLLEDLAGRGVDARCVVVACDENRQLAAAAGLDTLAHSNEDLAGRVNAGFRYAGEHGAEFILMAGSDDWIHPDYLHGIDPSGETVHTTRNAAVVREDGRLIAYLDVPYTGGEGLRVWPRRLLERCGFEPVPRGKQRAIDTNVLAAVAATGGEPVFRYRRGGMHEIVDFKTATNLNTYREVVGAFGVTEEPDPFNRLRRDYPGWLVDEVEAVYADA